MQIKSGDGRHHDILSLERLLDRPRVPAATRKRIEAEIRQIQAGEKAERDAAYQIEVYFGPSDNWVTIHDLRIEVDGLVAQIDHLVINRLAEIWVCESKSFGEGVSINDHGEWARWWHGRPEGMPSPIEQNRRHIHLLERAFDEGLARRRWTGRLGSGSIRRPLWSPSDRFTFRRQRLRGGRGSSCTTGHAHNAA